MIYLHKHEFNISDKLNLITYEEARSSPHSNVWLDAMKDQIKYMRSNNVWDLVNCQKVTNQLDANRSLKLKETNGQMKKI